MVRWMNTRQEYREADKRYNKNLRSERSRIWAKEAARFLASKQWKIARNFIFEHFGKECVNCQSTENIQLDHIHPRVKDNKAKRWLDITNLQPLCGDCNSKIKGTKSTDYRSYPDKYKAIDLKSLYESTFRKANTSTKWDVRFDSVNNRELYKGSNGKECAEGLTLEQKKYRRNLRVKAKQHQRCNYTAKEIIAKLDVDHASADFKHIVGFVTKITNPNHIKKMDLKREKRRIKKKSKRQKKRLLNKK